MTLKKEKKKKKTRNPPLLSSSQFIFDGGERIYEITSFDPLTLSEKIYHHRKKKEKKEKSSGINFNSNSQSLSRRSFVSKITRFYF